MKNPESGNAVMKVLGKIAEGKLPCVIAPKDSVVTITIPRRTPSGNEMRRKYRDRHVYAKLRQEWDWAVLTGCPVIQKHYLETAAASKLRVQVGIHVKRLKLLDRDNFWSGLKVCFDALTRCGFIVDDSEKWIDAHVSQQVAPHDETIITLRILGWEATSVREIGS